jgi:membrane protein YdbS with pleckstrin-like domain
MKNEMLLNILYEEYKMASQRIEDYQNKHLSFFNGITFVSVGVISYITKDNPDFIKFTFIFPYFLILLLLLMHYHYRRTLVVQGHRKALEEKINFLINDANPLIFSKLSEKYIIEPKNNYSIIFFSLLVIIGFVFSLYFASFISNKFTHFYLQVFLLLIVLFFYIHSTYKIKRLSYIFSKKNIENYEFNN